MERGRGGVGKFGERFMYTVGCNAMEVEGDRVYQGRGGRGLGWHDKVGRGEG